MRDMKRPWQRGAWLLLAAGLVLGCYDPTFKDCELECGPSIRCPGGMTCQGGLCTSGPQCPTGTGPDADAGDAGMDLLEDVSPDLPTDSTIEAPPDVATDIALEAPPDVPTDIALEAPPDVATDVALEAPPDVPADMAIEAPPDVATDVALETPPDVPSVGDGSSPETPGGDGKAPWTPAVIPNLVLWLEGDRGIDATPGAKVSAWRDQSPLHNDAKQTTDMFAPKFAAGPFSGAPGLEFSSKAWMTIREDQSLRWGVFDFLVLVVYRSTARCEGSCILQQLYRKQEVDWPWRGPGLGIQPAGRIEVHLDHDAPNQWLSSPATGYDSGNIHLVGAQRRWGWPSLRIDGRDFPAPVPSTVTNLDAPGENVYFGAHGLNPDPPVDFPFSGYIGAIVAVQGPISDADLAQLESYLMLKYGAVAGSPP